MIDISTASVLAFALPALFYAVTIWLASVVMTGISMTVNRAHSLFGEMESAFELAGIHIALVLLTLVHAILLVLFGAVWLVGRLFRLHPATRPSPDDADRAPLMETVREGDGATTIVLVHGTFARHARWIQPGSYLVGQVLAKAAMQGTTPAIVRFLWCGRNDEHARRNAGIALAAELEKLADSGRRVMVVAHSHGGSVLLHALRHTERPDLVAAAAFVGVPFFQIEQVAALERISFLWWLLPNTLIVIVGVLAAIPIASKWGTLPILIGVPAIMWRLSLWRERVRRKHEAEIPWLLDLGVVRHLDSSNVLIASTTGDEAQGLLRYAGLISQALSHAIDRVIYGARHYDLEQPQEARTLTGQRSALARFFLNAAWLLFYAAAGLFVHVVLRELPIRLTPVMHLALLVGLVLGLGFAGMRMVPLAIRQSGLAGVDLLFVPYSVMLFVNGLAARYVFGLPAAVITRNCLALISEVPVGTWQLHQYRPSRLEQESEGFLHTTMHDDADIVEQVSQFLAERARSQAGAAAPGAAAPGTIPPASPAH